MHKMPHLPRLIQISILLLAAVLAINQITPPTALPASAPAQQFSAGRAMQYLNILSARPRPWGDNGAARQYILDILQQNDISASVQQVSTLESKGKPVNNVVARLPGQTGGTAILVMAHYDTVSLSPGAGDNGSGSVILLELGRARSGRGDDADIMAAPFLAATAGHRAGHAAHHLFDRGSGGPGFNRAGLKPLYGK